MNKQRKKRKEKFWSGSGKFFLMVIFIYLAFYGSNKIYQLSNERSDSYKKTDIEIVGNRMVSSAKILQICGFTSKEDKEININIDEIATRLMEFKYIKGISITRRPPKILNITVEEFNPVAFIYGKGLNLIDGEGMLIPIPDAKIIWDLPLISGLKQGLGRLGSKTVAGDAYLALEVVRYLEDENPLLASMISEIDLSNSKTIELHLIKGGAKIRVNRETFYKELFVLKNYIANYLDWGQLAKIEYIDLRFENQLIVKAKT
jgi:cell division septal protein FtsQ